MKNILRKSSATPIYKGLKLMTPHIGDNKKVGGLMTKLIKKTILAAPIAAIATLGFAATAFAATSFSANHAPLSVSKITVVDTHAADYAYKTANYGYGYKYTPRKSYYKGKSYKKSYSPYYKPVYKTKHKSFGHSKGFSKSLKRKIQYKY